MFLPTLTKPETSAKEIKVEEEMKDSSLVKRWQSLSNWQMRSIFFAIGLTSANFVRPNPSFFWLYIMGILFGGLVLIFFPSSDSEAKKYQGLWRTSGVALYAGALFVWWDLLKFLQMWHIVGFVCSLFVVFLIVCLVIGSKK
jgi:predicted membrane channel-forming protein YqfA (hemolysin III family)